MKIEYFNPVAVRFEGIEIINIYPNPVQGIIQFIILSAANTEITIKAIDMIGRTVIDQSSFIAEGENTFIIDVSNLSKSIY